MTDFQDMARAEPPLTPAEARGLERIATFVAVAIVAFALTLVGCGSDPDPVKPTATTIQRGPNTPVPVVPTTATDQSVTPEAAQGLAKVAVKQVDACVKSLFDAQQCTTDAPGSLGPNTGLHLVKGAPKAGEVSVQTHFKHRYKVIAADGTGVRWVIAVSPSGKTKRTCRLGDGRPCTPATW